MEPFGKKSLGQHWLNDHVTLTAMANAAQVSSEDTVLEIGPGTGNLTSILAKQAKHVIAVEFDEDLAELLQQRQLADNVQIINEDIRKFDLTSLPAGYKIAANIPYYLTANLLRLLTDTPNKPAVAALLVQKEVAERVAASPGQMSFISVVCQLFYEVSLGALVPAHLFTPPPQVDSQILILKSRAQPLYDGIDYKKFYSLVKAGFSERRKKLRSSLAGGQHLGKDATDNLLKKAGINPDARAQELSLDDWHRIYQTR